MQADAVVSAFGEHRADDLVAIFHSHPESRAVPSKVDIADAVRYGWHEPYHVLISPRVADVRRAVRAFLIAPDGTYAEHAIALV